MLYFDRTDVSELIDLNKTRESKECDICHYGYIYIFFKLSFNRMSAIDTMIY